MEYTIDAKGKTVGRVATEAATILMGKHSAQYAPEKVPSYKVRVQNASGLIITEQRKASKQYIRYSGYPGGLTETSMQDMIDKKGNEEVLRIAIKGMLPGNKLQKFMLKNLTITA